MSGRRVSVQGWGFLPGGCLPEGCSPPVDRMTDTCENITFPQLLLRSVNMSLSYSSKRVGTRIQPDGFKNGSHRHPPHYVAGWGGDRER